VRIAVAERGLVPETVEIGLSESELRPSTAAGVALVANL
jgi:hypothetical protein